MIPLTPTASTDNTFEDSELICYCFEYTKQDIAEDYANHGFSRILAKIKTAKKRGGCNCAAKNPKGR
jgi:hypothetical protein